MGLVDDLETAFQAGDMPGLPSVLVIHQGDSLSECHFPCDDECWGRPLSIERFKGFVVSDADQQRDSQPDDAYHLLADRHARPFEASFIEEFQHAISPGIRSITAP